MSRTIYEKVNENYTKTKEVGINNKSSFHNTHLQSYKLLLEIIDDKNLEVEMILPSSSLVWLKIGHPFSLHVEELGKIFQGKIERIVSKVDPVSQSLKLYGSIDVNVEHLYPGMSGTIKIQP